MSPDDPSITPPRNETDPASRDRVLAYLEGNLSREEAVTLERDLKNSPKLRRYYLQAVRTDTLLRELSELPVTQTSESELAAGGNEKIIRPNFGRAALAAAAAVALLFVPLYLHSQGELAAELVASEDARWSSRPHQPGDTLRVGTLLELESGVIDLRYLNGATARLHAPIRFQIDSTNSGFLHYGDANCEANGEACAGFTIKTRAGNFVDRGTKFLTSANQDGSAQLHVTKGAVDAQLPGFQEQRVQKGAGLGVEGGKGKAPILIKIEKGESTSAFKFPTLPPPSDLDFASRSQEWVDVEVWTKTARGEGIHNDSGPPKVVLDGQGQSEEDRPDQSLYLANDETGFIMMDLGKPVSISRLHTYTWRRYHRTGERSRAVQRYTLWAAKDKLPDGPPEKGNPNGWKRVARVDSDAFFEVDEMLDRPAQQACALIPSGKSLGTYRYLLFDTQPTQMPPGETRSSHHTFFGEIDVFVND